MTRLAVMLTFGLAAVPAALGAEYADIGATRLQLRAQAAVAGGTVRLADVLVLSDAPLQLVQQLSDAPVVSKRGAPAPTSVTHAEVVQRLEELGVNLSQVLISGAVQCRITQEQAAAPAAGADNEIRPRPASRNDAAGTARSLADVLQDYVNKELAPVGGTAELSFERAGEEILRLTSPPWDFSVSSPGREKLGPREFQVIIRRDGQVQRRVDVFAQVHVVRSVVVALRPLSIGNFIRREDVGLETRVFDQGTNLGQCQTEAVVGQQVKRFIPAGELVPADALKAVDMVVRSRPVTVTGAEGSVQLRLSGTALDSGTYGESVRVRLGDGRRDRQVLRGTVTGMGTVRLSEGVQ